MAKKLRKIPTENTYFAIMCPHRGLGGETFTTNCTVERAIFQPLQLGLVVPQMLLQVGQLNKGSTAIRHVAFVRTFTYKEQSNPLFNKFLDKKKLPFLQSDVWVCKEKVSKSCKAWIIMTVVVATKEGLHCQTMLHTQFENPQKMSHQKYRILMCIVNFSFEFLR